MKTYTNTARDWERIAERLGHEWSDMALWEKVALQVQKPGARSREIAMELTNKQAKKLGLLEDEPEKELQ